jgi:dTDP-4-dehydrorhamnose reductase
MRVFVVGSQGQVAHSLKDAAAGHVDLTLHGTDRSECDLSRPASIAAAIRTFRPDIVINPAAYTAVDKAEAEPDLAFALNRDGARAVAAAADEQSVPVIHISTDYVFDGRKTEPYVESDPVNPQGVYGRSKLAGELAVAEANPRHVILRTSWVYAPFGGNFVRTMLRLAAERDELRVVDDQIGCPTYAPDIAAAVLAIAGQVVGRNWQARFAGVTHLAAPDAMSWYDFARAITMGASVRGMRSIPVQPIRTSDYPTAAVRPANSRLATARLRDVFDVALPRMQHSLADCLDHLLKS